MSKYEAKEIDLINMLQCEENLLKNYQLESQIKNNKSVFPWMLY